MKIGIRRRCMMITLLSAVALSTAACTVVHGAVAASSSPTPQGSPGAIPPSSSPTPSPIAEVSAPQRRVPLTCADLATQRELSAMAPVTMKLSTFPYPTVLDPYVFTQAGGLYCDWVSSRTDGTLSPSYELDIEIVPDTTAAQRQKVARVLAHYQQNGSAHRGLIAPHSVTYCFGALDDSDHPEGGCQFLASVGGTAIEVFIQGAAHGAGTDAGAIAAYSPQLHTVVDAVRGVKVKQPGWSDPGVPTITWTSDTPVSTDEVGDATGETMVRLDPGDGAANTLVEAIPSNAANEVEHEWTPSSDQYRYVVAVTVIPAGAWAWKQVDARAHRLGGYQTITDLPGQGAGDHVIAYHYSIQNFANYDVEATSGHSLVVAQVGFETDVNTDLAPGKPAEIVREIAGDAVKWLADARDG